MNDDGSVEGALSRRNIIGGAGLAIAGGVALTAVTGAQAAAADSGVATGPSGTTTVEFRGRISQTGSSGQVFASYGYLTKLAGASSDDLFAAAPPSEATALFTVFATGNLVQRTFDDRVHVLDVAGELTVYQRDTAGATFADPSSFAVGNAVARFGLTLQDVLTVFAPASGLPTLTGDMRQRTAGRLSGGLRGSTFGQSGLRLRFFATGIGTLVDPATSNSQLEIAGNWSAA